MEDRIIENVEKQRQELEANLTKFRSALKHWQTLELDYEGLKDEFLGLGDHATKQQYLDAAHDFGPHKVDEKELIELIEPSKGKVRQPNQIIDTLTKRAEYVSRNVASLRTQITDLERKRNALLPAGKPEHEDEAGIPISEITEELDDDDNVMSSKVQQQADSASKVLHVLEKAEVRTQEGLLPSTAELPEQRIEELEDDDGPGIDSNVEQVEHSDSDDRPSSISFPADTEEEAGLRQEMLQYSGLDEISNIVAELEMAEGDEELDDDEDIEIADSLSEVDENDIDDFSDDDSEVDSDEDGRIKHSEKYRKQMEKLQEKLGLKLENVGPTPDLPKEIRDQIEVPKPEDADEYLKNLPPNLRKHVENNGKPPAKEAARKAAIAREEAARSASKAATNTPSAIQKTKKSKKKVAFAPDLDIANEDIQQPRTATTSESIIERSSSDPISTTPSRTKKPSLFKTTRAQPQSRPEPAIFPPPLPTHPTSTPSPTLTPANRTHATTLIERPTPTSTPTAPDNEGVDFDEELQKRQIALEHHRLRNKIVHDQGGYVRGGELENWGDEVAAPEVRDERTGEVRRVSRFKASRMR